MFVLRSSHESSVTAWRWHRPLLLAGKTIKGVYLNGVSFGPQPHLSANGQKQRFSLSGHVVRMPDETDDTLEKLEEITSLAIRAVAVSWIH